MGNISDKVPAILQWLLWVLEKKHVLQCRDSQRGWRVAHIDLQPHRIVAYLSQTMIGRIVQDRSPLALED